MLMVTGKEKHSEILKEKQMHWDFD